MQEKIQKILSITISTAIFIAAAIIVCAFLHKEKTSPTQMSIANVFIKGNKFTNPSEIQNIIGNLQGIYINSIPDNQIESALLYLPFIKSAKVIKKYPHDIIIKIDEKNIKFMNENEYPLDEHYQVINSTIQNTNLKNNLIKIHGTPDKIQTEKLFKELDKMPFIKKRITDIILISNRRWDLIFNIHGKNMLFRLPEENIVKALTSFFKSTYKSNILAKNISIIDLRSDKILIK